MYIYKCHIFPIKIKGLIKLGGDVLKNGNCFKKERCTLIYMLTECLICVCGFCLFIPFV